MAATYRLSPLRRVVNALVRPLVRLGVGDRNTYLLSVPGRKTGRVYSTPVILVEEDGRRWLVAPYGERSWVKNARAAGGVELSRGGRTERVQLAELGPEESAPVLREYLTRVPITRKYFDVTPGSPLEAFAAEASRHPVFEIIAEAS